jgi:hypothetical protein
VTAIGSAPKRLSPGRDLVLVSLLYLLLTGILTYPTMVRLGSDIPGFGDAPRMAWDAWAFARAITDPQVPLSTTELIFHPLPDVPTLWEGTPSLLLAVPLELLFGAVISYSLIFVLSFVLAGSFTFLLARHLSVNRVASFVAGAIFSFCAYHYAHGLGHMHVFSIQWLPLCALALLRFWDRPGIGRAAHLALALVLVVTDSPYYALYFAAPLLVCFFVYQMWRDRARLFERRFLAGVVLALAVATASAVMVYPRMFFPDQEIAESIARQTSDVEKYSADLMAYVLPSRMHPLFGELVTPIYARFLGFPNDAEMIVYVGYAALVLAVWGLTGGRRTDVAFWALLGLAGLTLSLGPVLQVNGLQVIGSPYAALTRLPIFGSLRCPSRASVTLQLAVAVLAGYGLDDLLGRMGNRTRAKTLLGAAVVVVVSFESLYSLPYPTSSTALPAFYRQLAAQDEQVAVLELPTGSGRQRNTAWYMLYQTFHGKELAHGYVARPPDSVTLFPSWVLGATLLSPPMRLPDSDTWPVFEAAFADLLAYNSIQYVVVQQQAGPSALPYSEEQYREVRASLTRSLGEPFYEDEGLEAHEVSPRVPEVRGYLGEWLQLVDHKLVRTTSCPGDTGECTFLVTFWQANAPVDERYWLYLRVTGQNQEGAVASRSHVLGYQYTLEEKVASYDTRRWSPGVVITDYTLLPSTDSEGALLDGPLDIRLFVANRKTGERLEAHSDYYAIDDKGRLLLDSYWP